MQEYSRGKKKSAVKKIGSTKNSGTIVTFTPDTDIFGQQGFGFERIVSHMRQQAYLVRGLRISVIDARAYPGEIDLDEVFYFREMNIEAPSQSFYFEGGLVSLIRFTNQMQKPVHKNIFYVEKGAEGVESVEVALQYVDDISSRILPFANNIYNNEGGTHITGFKTALTRTLNSYANKGGGKNDDNFTGDDVLEGLTAVISVKLREIQFEGQTKAKLGSMEAQSAVATVFGEAFSAFLEENPDDAKAMISKAMLAMKARKAAKAAKDSILRKGALEGMTLPGKLADCESSDASESEVFIVEGDSAGGTAKTGRNRRTQAVLPLRGKILNIERARLDRMLASEQIKNLVIAMGTAIGETFDLSKLRYHKIIIATDADVDGAHIRTLILTLLYRYFRPIIDGGYIYIAQPPLYKVKRGKEVMYFYTEEEKAKTIGSDMPLDVEEGGEDVPETEEEETPVKGVKKTQKIHVQRYKGLGEMNAEELWETTMDPARRLLKQVTINDAQEADKIFDMLMGTDVPARKSFIQSNAHKATIDV